MTDIDEIRRYKELRADWDGEGADKISIAAIDNAISFVENYKGKLFFDSCPLADGDVALESGVDAKVMLCFSDTGVAYYIRLSDKKAVHKGSGTDNETIYKILAALEPELKPS